MDNVGDFVAWGLGIAVVGVLAAPLFNAVQSVLKGE